MQEMKLQTELYPSVCAVHHDTDDHMQKAELGHIRIHAHLLLIMFMYKTGQSFPSGLLEKNAEQSSLLFFPIVVLHIQHLQYFTVPAIFITLMDIFQMHIFEMEGQCLKQIFI